MMERRSHGPSEQIRESIQDRLSTRGGRRRRYPRTPQKDREKRAVEQLYQKWMQSREHWATSAFEVVVSALPAHASVRLGSVSAAINARFDPERNLPIIHLEVANRTALSDFPTVATDPERGSAIAVYGTSEQSSRLALYMPAFAEEQVIVYRTYPNQDPVGLQIERTLPDGRATSETIPAARLGGASAIILPTEDLQIPCPITWWWNAPLADPRPAIVFPDSEL
jgi:hypothetical protein